MHLREIVLPYVARSEKMAKCYGRLFARIGEMIPFCLIDMGNILFNQWAKRVLLFDVKSPWHCSSDMHGLLGWHAGGIR